MLLEEIRFEGLQLLPVQLKWGDDNFLQERFFYHDDHRVYKLWHRKYAAHRLEVSAGKYVAREFRNSASHLAAIDCGLVNRETCPAFEELILERAGHCRGYIMLKGTPVTRNAEVSPEFIDLLWHVTLRTGYAHTDFCVSNIVRVGRALSLVDIDSNPTDLRAFDMQFERAKGSLRRHVVPEYRQRLESHAAAKSS